VKVFKLKDCWIGIILLSNALIMLININTMLEEKRKIIRIGYTQIRVNEVDEKKKVRGTT